MFGIGCIKPRFYGRIIIVHKLRSKHLNVSLNISFVILFLALIRAVFMDWALSLLFKYERLAHGGSPPLTSVILGWHLFRINLRSSILMGLCIIYIVQTEVHRREGSTWRHCVSLTGKETGSMRQSDKMGQNSHEIVLRWSHSSPLVVPKTRSSFQFKK